MDKEIWKNFIFCEKEYKISSHGNVCNLDNKPLQQRTNDDGYKMITLGIHSKRNSFRVHCLVAQHFVYNAIGENAEVNHIDFDRSNNHYLNLEWLTHLENIQKSIDAGRMYYQTHDVSGINNPNYGNRKLSEIYFLDKDYAKEKQGRPGLKNGRCVPVKMTGNGCEENFLYINDCVDYILENSFSTSTKNSIHSNISISLKNNTPYLGFLFYRI